MPLRPSSSLITCAVLLLGCPAEDRAGSGAAQQTKPLGVAAQNAPAPKAAEPGEAAARAIAPADQADVVPRSRPQVVGVLGAGDPGRSVLVVFARGEPQVLATFEHAAGWLPRVAVDLERQLAAAAIVPPGRRHGSDAELVRIDLATSQRTTVAASVPPSQAPLLVDGRIVHTVVDGRSPGAGGGMDRVKLRLLDGASTRLELSGHLLWPLFTVGADVITLVTDDRGARLLAVSGDGQRLIRDFGKDVVRDFSATADRAAVVHQRRRSDGSYVVERTTLSGAVTVLHTDTLPWLAPLDTAAGTLISRSPSATEGQLLLRGARELAPIALPVAGAPIPIAAAGAWAVVRVQSPKSQAYLLVDAGGEDVHPLPSGGQPLESVVVLQ